MKKWWLAAGGSIFALLLLLTFLPQIFQKNIERIVQKELNEAIEGTVSFSRLKISLWRHFPNLSVGVHDLAVSSADFPQDTLLKVEKMWLSVDTYDYLRHGVVDLRHIKIEKPEINAKVYYAGVSNFSILKPDTTSADTTAGNITLHLENIEIENGSVRYIDEYVENDILIRGLNFKGSGNFTNDEFDMTTRFSADSVNIIVEGEPYLANKKLDLSFLFKIDRVNNEYEIANSDILVNSFPLKITGKFSIDPGRYGFDLAFDSPGSSIKEILSLTDYFQREMRGLTTGGNSAFAGNIHGNYIPGTDSIPQFNIRLEIKNGSLRLGTLKDSITDVHLGVLFSNTAGIIDSTVFRMDTIFFRVKNHVVQGHAHVVHLAKSTVDAELSGSMDVDELLEIYPIEGVDADGLIDFDVKVSGKYSRIGLNSSAPHFDFAVSLKDGKLKYDSLPDSLNSVNFSMHGSSPQGNWQKAHVVIEKFKLNIGDNPVEGKLAIDDLTRPNIDAVLKASLNAEDIMNIFPFDNLQMKGTVEASATVNGVYDPEVHAFPNVTATLSINDGYLKLTEYPEPLEEIHLQADIKNVNGKLESSVLTIGKFTFKTGSERAFIKGTISDFDKMGYDLSIKGSINLGKLTKIFPIDGYTVSGRIHPDVEVTGTLADLAAGKYERTKATGTIKLNKFTVSGKGIPLPVNVDEMVMRLSPETIFLDNMHVKTGHSVFSLKGEMKEYFSFFENGQELVTAKLNLLSDSLNLNEWKDIFTDSNRTQLSLAADAKPIPSPWRVPGNIDFTFDSNIKHLEYEDIVAENLGGELRMKDGVIALKETGFSSLGAKFSADGSYDSRDITHPLFDFTFDVDGLDIQKAYKDMRIVRELLPAAGDAAGMFSLDYSLKGELDPTMYPKISTLKGGGVMHIAEAKINGMKIFEKLSKAAKKKEINNPHLKDFTMTTEIHDNRVFVKPFEVKVSGFNAEIEGITDISGEVDYIVRVQLLPFDKAKIPFNVSGTYDNPKIALGKGHKLPDELENK